MDLFSMPINVVLTQVIGGLFTGLCFGVSIASDYERNMSFQQRRKVWKWVKEKNFSYSWLIGYVIKVLIAIAIIAYINVFIAKSFDAYPISKTWGNKYLYGVMFFASAYLFRYVRYFYFKRKLSKVS